MLYFWIKILKNPKLICIKRYRFYIASHRPSTKPNLSNPLSVSDMGAKNVSWMASDWKRFLIGIKINLSTLFIFGEIVNLFGDDVAMDPMHQYVVKDWFSVVNARRWGSYIWTCQTMDIRYLWRKINYIILSLWKM